LFWLQHHLVPDEHLLSHAFHRQKLSESDYPNDDSPEGPAGCVLRSALSTRLNLFNFINIYSLSIHRETGRGTWITWPDLVSIFKRQAISQTPYSLRIKGSMAGLTEMQGSTSHKVSDDITEKSSIEAGSRFLVGWFEGNLEPSRVCILALSRSLPYYSPPRVLVPRCVFSDARFYLFLFEETLLQRKMCSPRQSEKIR
jgi:hypothetical protein